jgi:hypothetical protein
MRTRVSAVLMTASSLLAWVTSSRRRLASATMGGSLLEKSRGRAG